MVLGSAPGTPSETKVIRHSPDLPNKPRAVILRRLAGGLFNLTVDYPKSCLWLLAGALIGAGTGTFQGFLGCLGVFLAVVVFANYVGD